MNHTSSFVIRHPLFNLHTLHLFPEMQAVMKMADLTGFFNLH